MKKIISMVAFVSMVLVTTSFIPHVEGIPAKKPTYNNKQIKYIIIERDLSSEIGVEPAVEIEDISATENIVPPAEYDTILVEKRVELKTRYIPTPNERKLMAALVWREDHTSIESMMAVAEVVLNRLESDVYSFSKLRTVEDVIFQDGWIKGCYVEQYIGAKNLYNIDPPDEAFEAVDRVCAGETTIGSDALFHAEKTVPSWEIANDIYVLNTVGATNFWAIKE